MTRFGSTFLGLCLACCLIMPAKAHQESTAYLDVALSGEGVTARLELSLDDLDYALGLDANADRELDWSEVDNAAPRIQKYVEAGLSLSSSKGDCRIAQGKFAVEDRAHGGPYLVIPLEVACVNALPNRLTYELLFEHDRRHRVKTTVAAGDKTMTEVLTSRRRVLSLPNNATH
ncbi:MAG: hypothetical protein AAF557_22850 [Pseudomonadota bacterium]